MKKQTDIPALRRKLLDWYDLSGRTLPWRIRPEDRANGQIADPYAVWLSEIMLQQTTVPHGTPYWHKFLNTFPTVIDLANADRDQVLAMWAGLGYYARARNLHKCAQIIRDQHDGHFPTSEQELLKLPGIGPYTAATMAAICFDEPTNIVDGNVERVIARMFCVEIPLPKAKTEIKNLAAQLADPERPGDYGQALMDLGAIICTPTSPKCNICPWKSACKALSQNTVLQYPRKIKKAKLPIRHGAAFVLMRGQQVLLERRPDTGLLGGMMGFPGSDWGEEVTAPLNSAPAIANWEKATNSVRHVFTHFELRLDVYTSQTQAPQMPDQIWADVTKIDEFALPSLMKKVLRAALEIHNVKNDEAKTL